MIMNEFDFITGYLVPTVWLTCERKVFRLGAANSSSDREQVSNQVSFCERDLSAR